MTIQLGDKVRDKVSGFTGIAVCRADWISGCLRYTVQAPAKKDGTLQECQSFDVEQLEVVKSGSVKLSDRRTGGPMPTPPRATNPTR